MSPRPMGFGLGLLAVLPSLAMFPRLWLIFRRFLGVANPQHAQSTETGSPSRILANSGSSVRSRQIGTTPRSDAAFKASESGMLSKSVAEKTALAAPGSFCPAIADPIKAAGNSAMPIRN